MMGSSSRRFLVALLLGLAFYLLLFLVGIRLKVETEPTTLPTPSQPLSFDSLQFGMPPPQSKPRQTTPTQPTRRVQKSQESSPVKAPIEAPAKDPEPSQNEPTFQAPTLQEINDALFEEKRGARQERSPAATSTPKSQDQIKKLYSEEWSTLSEAEQAFIEKELNEIGRITQSYLEYPRIAGKLGQEGIALLEFYLHPNGDISDLKILKASGYTLLDRNSEKTIQIAYKDYPRPEIKTKIKILFYYGILK